MLKALIVGRVKENHDLHTLACEAVIHDLVAVSLIAQVVQLVGDVLDCLALKRRCVTLVTIQTGDFT